MAAELVNAATSDKLSETDWTKNIEICELVARDKRQARDVVKVIKKKLGSKHPNTQLYAVTLLEMLMNNTGEHIHEQVIDIGVIPILVKIVKKKSDLPVRERIFLLLDATQSSLGGASGKFPQYYHAYYDLVNAGVQFPQSAQVVESNHASSQPSRTGSIPNREQASPRHEAAVPQAESKTVPESSIIQKAGNALEVLKEVLDAVDAQHPQGASDEFTLDLVEQCSFQKQRVMHLVMASRDERTVSRAIELNEQLQKVLARHEDLVSGSTTTTANEQIPKDLPRHDNVVSGRATTTSNEQFPKVLPRRGDLVSGRTTTNANEQLPKVLPKRDDVVSGACDIRVCTEDAFFSVKEVDLALAADLGSLQRLPSIVGFGNAMELALTARRFSGLEAKELGLVSGVFHSQHELDEGVRELAQGIASKSPVAVVGTKTVLLKSRDLTVDQGLDFVATLNSARLLSSDLVEAVAAVKQKRRPVYSKL